MDDSANTCDKMIESYKEETKTKQPVKRKISIFFLHFY